MLPPLLASSLISRACDGRDDEENLGVFDPSLSDLGEEKNVVEISLWDVDDEGEEIRFFGVVT